MTKCSLRELTPSPLEDSDEDELDLDDARWMVVPQRGRRRRAATLDLDSDAANSSTGSKATARRMGHRYCPSVSNIESGTGLDSSSEFTGQTRRKSTDLH